MKPHFEGPGVTLYHGDCIEVMRSLPDESVHAVVTDPPYGLEFMGKAWDSFKPKDIGRGVKVAELRADEMTAAGKGHATSAGPYLAARVDSIRSAGLPFQQWCEEWARECMRVLKPGGHLLAFGGTRTWHRLASGVEDAGFEMRDSIAWLYGSGFPKSLDVAKAIDKAARGVPQGGADPTSINHGKYKSTKTEGKRWDGDSGQGYGAGGSRFLADGTASGLVTEPAESGAAAIAPEAETWRGWGTALKPAFEPVVVARKPLIGTVAVNVLTHGTGALNIDASRIGWQNQERRRDLEAAASSGAFESKSAFGGGLVTGNDAGRWPANVILDEGQAAALDAQTGILTSGKLGPTHTDNGKQHGAAYGKFAGRQVTQDFGGDSGGASRFFPTFRYEAKAPTSERPTDGLTAHPTVKPLDLMRWLVRLVTPPGGVVMEPFAGSGTTLEAAALEGFEVIGIEREPDYLPLIINRLSKPMQQSLFGDWEESA